MQNNKLHGVKFDIYLFYDLRYMNGSVDYLHHIVISNGWCIWVFYVINCDVMWIAHLIRIIHLKCFATMVYVFSKW